MSPERVRHAGTQSETAAILREALRRAGSPCREYVDGIAVRVRRDRAFVPDVLVFCPAPPPDAVEIDNPLIVVEAPSPGAAEVDQSLKLEGCLSLPSLVRRLVIHAREDGSRAATRILRSGPLRLDPRGVEIAVEELFEPGAEP